MPIGVGDVEVTDGGEVANLTHRPRSASQKHLLSLSDIDLF
jgi:hypothetical protein